MPTSPLNELIQIKNIKKGHLNFFFNVKPETVEEKSKTVIPGT